MKLRNQNFIAASMLVWCFGCSLDSALPATKKDGGAGTTGSSTTGSGPATSSAMTTSTTGSTGAGGGGGTGNGGASGATGTTFTGGAAGASGGSGGATTVGGGGSGGAAGSGGTATGGAGGNEADASDGNGGIVVDAAPEASTCAGFALQFDGSSGYAFLTRPVQDNFTIEAWIRTTTPSLLGTNFYQGNGLIYCDVGGTANDFGMSLLNNKLAFGIGNPDMTLIGATDVVTTGPWVHVAATRNATTGELQVIVNGVLDGTLTATNLGSLNAQAIVNLGGNTIDGRYYAGTMDEVRIWNVTRTASQIAATMHQRLVGNEPNLVGYYRFDDAGGAASVDSSPTMSPAGLAGGVVFTASDAPVCP